MAWMGRVAGSGFSQLQRLAPSARSPAEPQSNDAGADGCDVPHLGRNILSGDAMHVAGARLPTLPCAFPPAAAWRWATR